MAAKYGGGHLLLRITSAGWVDLIFAPPHLPLWGAGGSLHPRQRQKNYCMNIRQATEADLPAIHTLVAELAAYVNEGDKCVATIDDYRSDLAAGFFEAIVAEEDGTVVGMMLYYNAYSTWKGRMIYLEDFVLSTDYRRQGTGSKLWEALKKIGRDRGCKLLKWQIAESNTEAFKFYDAMGADIDTAWSNGLVKL